MSSEFPKPDTGLSSTQHEPQFVPVCFVGKEDLMSCRPDLAGEITELGEDDIASIADKLGDALQETYWLALDIVLTDYLGIQPSAAGNPPQQPTEQEGTP